MLTRPKFFFLKQLALIGYLTGCLLLSCGNPQDSNGTTQPDNGELASNFAAPIIVDTAVTMNQPVSQEEQLRLEGWEQTNLAKVRCQIVTTIVRDLENCLIS